MAMNAGAPSSRRGGHIVLMLGAMSVGFNVSAETVPTKGTVDGRVRVAAYNADEVYRLYAYAGYQIDLEFEPGETFVGLGAGDLEALTFVGQDNHLFLKPKAAPVATNLTVLTNRRHYQFDYSAVPARPAAAAPDVMYAVRFSYPQQPTKTAADAATARVESQLAKAPGERPANRNYGYCGHPWLKPSAASDDGVHTRLRFDPHAELPAIFVFNDDGSESLLNFSMEAGDVLIHRVARRFIVRRLTGCIVNQSFAGGATRLESGTVAPDVERKTLTGNPASGDP
jgi:type IV secretion system protein VirB9